MLNKVQLIGFLGADPDIRFTPEQEAVARVRIATSETWKKNGEKHEKTEWHNIVYFGKLAEIVRDHLKKGALVYVEGKLQTRSWDKDGETRYTTEIVAAEKRIGEQRTQTLAGLGNMSTEIATAVLGKLVGSADPAQVARAVDEAAKAGKP